MNWIDKKDRLPEKPGEYFIFERWIEQTEDGPCDSKLLGIAWFNGERFCNIITRWGSGDDGETITHWMECSEPSED